MNLAVEKVIKRHRAIRLLLHITIMAKRRFALLKVIRGLGDLVECLFGQVSVFAILIISAIREKVLGLIRLILIQLQHAAKLLHLFVVPPAALGFRLR